MNQALIDKIIGAVLYEGYLLYPYRPSIKNTQRWTFGGLYPRSHRGEPSSSEGYSMQCQCLLIGDLNTRIELVVGFLHLIERKIESTSGQQSPGTRLSDRWPFDSWQETIERKVTIEAAPIDQLLRKARCSPFAFPAQTSVDSLQSSSDDFVTAAAREQRAVQGLIELSVEPIDKVAPDRQVFRLTARVSNETPLDEAQRQSRHDALLSSLASTHLLLSARTGEFVSLIDPPTGLREAASTCDNKRCWPILLGEPSDRSTMLAPPIILYDYPEISPESPGGLFDSTEIDEILTLRIMTLTDTEKVAMATADPRARALLERVESLPPEQLLALHGVTRDA